MLETNLLVPEDNDKNTVISLREIGESKISIKTIEDAAINKLRKIQSSPSEPDDFDIDQEDDFDKIYKGEVSKSGAAILPSKRVRKIPEKLTTEFKTENLNEEKVKKTNDQVDEEIKEAVEEEKIAENKTE